MKLYADLPGRRTRQVVGDLLALGVLAVSVAAGAALWAQLHRLATRTRELSEAASTSATALDDGVSSLSGLPLVGDPLSDVLAQVSRFTTQTSGNLADQARQLAVEAPVVGIAVMAAGVALVGVSWGIGRLRWVRRASALAAAGGADLDVLALAALARADPVQLRRLGPDLAQRWRAGDPAAMRRLAGLEFAALGLRPPPELPAEPSAEPPPRPLSGRPH